jgi:glutathione S-transferase
MNEFVIHSIPGSPYGRAVFITLEEKHAPYRLSAVAPGAHRKPEHLRRHPFGRIPVMDHGDFRLYETQAILRYIDRALPTPPLTPKEPKVAARMDQLMNVNDWYLFQGVANVIGFQRIVGPRVMGLTPDEAAIAAAMPKAQAVFTELARQLNDNEFFTGDSLSLADILLAAHIDFFRATPEWAPLTQGRANLCAWLGRMNERPSLKATTWEHIAAMDRPSAIA